MSDVELYRLAEKARESAYVPYSGFAVGAAVLAGDGRVYTGGNIENAAYSVCNCAERTALFKAVSEGVRHITAVAVVGAKAGQAASVPCPPCGVCRQALFEFGGSTLRVIVADGKGGVEATTLGALLPDAFGPRNLE